MCWWGAASFAGTELFAVTFHNPTVVNFLVPSMRMVCQSECSLFVIYFQRAKYQLNFRRISSNQCLQLSTVREDISLYFNPGLRTLAATLHFTSWMSIHRPY